MTCSGDPTANCSIPFEGWFHKSDVEHHYFSYVFMNVLEVFMGCSFDFLFSYLFVSWSSVKSVFLELLSTCEAQ